MYSKRVIIEKETNSANEALTEKKKSKFFSVNGILVGQTYNESC